MHQVQSLLLVSVCCAIAAGCNAAKVQELSDKVQSLETKVEELQNENAALKSQLALAQQQSAEFEEIKNGYEAARAKFAQNLAQLGPLLGLSESPLPPFEGLKDSSWIGSFSPNVDMTSGLDALKDELRGLLGTGAAPSPRTPSSPDEQ